MNNTIKYFQKIVFHAYNAYAPEYTYPTPIIQISQAIEFLKSNSELNLNLNCIAFGGDSADGHPIGKLINIQTSKEYARELNISPVLPPESILNHATADFPPCFISDGNHGTFFE